MLPPQGGICIQGENEIASMGYCIGFHGREKGTHRHLRPRYQPVFGPYFLCRRHPGHPTQVKEIDFKALKISRPDWALASLENPS